MKTPNEIIEISRNLRKNMTVSERIIWNFVKEGKLGVKFLRQKPILVCIQDDGFPRYVIPDFYCHEKKLVLEIDGSIHNKKDVILLDETKQVILEKLGYKILRVKNEDVLGKLSEVLYNIKEYL